MTLAHSLTLILMLALAAAGPTAAELRAVVQQGHQAGIMGWISDADFAADGRAVVTASRDATLRLWHVPTGRLLRVLGGHTSWVRALDIDASGTRMVSSGGDGKVLLWDLATGTVVRQLEISEGRGTAIAISPDGRTVVSDVYGGSIRWWSADDWKPVDIQAQGEGFAVNALAFSPDGTLLYSAGSDAIVHAWNPESRARVHSYTGGHKAKIVALGLSRDGKRMATGSTDWTVAIWDTDKEKKLLTLEMEGVAQTLSFSADGSLLIAGIGSGKGERKHEAIVWDVSSGKRLRVLTTPEEVPVIAKFGPDGHVALTGTSKGNLRLWDVDTGHVLRDLAGDTLAVRTVEQPDAASLWIGGGDGEAGFAVRWDLAAGRIAQRLPRSAKAVDSINVDAYGRVWVGGWKGRVEIVDPTTGEATWSVPVEDYPMLYRRANEADTIWVSTREALREYDLDPPEIRWVRGNRKRIILVSTEAELIAVADTSGGVEIWSKQEPEALHTLEGRKRLNSIALSPDATLLATATSHPESLVNLWDTRSGDLLWSYDGHGHHVLSLDFSADGKRLLTGSRDHTAHVLDVTTGENLLSLSGHTAAVHSARFVPGGRIVTASGDGTARIWEGDQHIATLVPIGEADHAVITADGYYTVSPGAIHGMHFSSGFDIYTFDSLDLVLNRPDRVAEALGVASGRLVDAYRRAYEHRLAKMGFDALEVGRDMKLPIVELLGEPPPLHVEKRKLKLEVTARDERQAIDRLNVFVNGVPVYGTRGLTLNRKDARQIDASVEIELSAGNNHVQVSVHNAAGLESLRESFDVEYRGPAEPSTLHIVAIGVSDYADDDFDLEYAAKDARDVIRKFQKHRSGKVKVHALTDGEVTRENILALYSVLERTAIDDQVVVFVAGHGLLDDQFDYWYATHDMDFSAPGKRGIRYAELDGLLDGIPARRKIMMIDTCHSGEIDTGSSGELTVATNVKARGFKARPSAAISGIDIRELSKLVGELFADLRRGTGTVVISSASGLEFAYESREYKNGLFTYALLEGLEGAADANDDGHIAISELQRFVVKRVSELTGGIQTPTTRQQNLEDDFDLL